MVKINSWIFIFCAWLASCSPQEEQEANSANAKGSEDIDAYASIAGVDPYDSDFQRQLFILLSEQNIDVHFGGSVVYGVFVEKDKAEDAIALIKESKLQVSFPAESHAGDQAEKSKVSPNSQK